MLRLNLLADEAKQTTKNRRLYYLILKTEMLLLFVFLGVSAVFFFSEQIVASNINKVNLETSRLIAAEGNDYGRRARDINSQLATVSKIQSSFVSYYNFLDNFAPLTPAGVSLSYLRLDTTNKKIKIRGLATRREDLLNLEKNLKNAPFLSNVAVPLADKLKKDLIDFDIDINLDMTKLPAS